MPGVRSRSTLGALVALLGWVALTLTVASAVGRRTFPLGLLVHFWPQIAICLLTAATLACVGRAWRTAAAQGAGGLVLLVAVGILAAGSAPRAEAEPELRALFANVASWNRQPDRVIDLIRRERPDVIGLAEVDFAWMSRLQPLRADYPHAIDSPRDDDYGLVLLSRVPLSDPRVEILGPTALPTLFARVETRSGPWQLVITHPVPPFHRAAFHSRNLQLRAVAREVMRSDVPVVLLGDLNATPWSPPVRDLTLRSGLRVASAGLRGLYTWPVGIPPLALALDYCLVSEEIAYVQVRVLPDIGSDHFPIVCELAARR